MKSLVVAIAISLLVRTAAADSVRVTVIEVAGGLAYLDKGSRDGVVPGTRVAFGGKVAVVVEVTATSAVIELGPLALGTGARGTAVATPAARVATQLPKPRPLAVFRDQWPAPDLPASTQRPRRVALGDARARGRASVTVVGHGVALVDRSRSDGSAEARVIASFELMNERPFAVDVDVAGRAYRDGANRLERAPVFVRAAQLRYGEAADPRLALGRLRHAASSVGMLDGVRGSVHLGRLELAAFGGLVADPVSGRPTTEASRFGSEAIFGDETAAWRPRIAVTAHGSTWNGEIDERRLAASASMDRAAVWLDAWAEVQAFSSSNPWGAGAVELTGAGATAAWRERGGHITADITFLRPERSLRLAAALPPAWLCTQQPQPGDVPNEPCAGGDSWASGSLTAGLRGGRWSVDAIGSIGRTNGVAVSHDASGLLLGDVRVGRGRVFAGVSAGQSSFARWTAGQLGAGFAWRRFDVAVTYRPELLDFVAATEALVLHAGVLDLHHAIAPDLDLAVSAAGTTGADRDVLAILSTIVWRPWP
jgi:hypothetical protein